MNLIVTGNKGFIGRQLELKLINENHNVTGIEADFLDNSGWEALLEKKVMDSDLVFHVGAISDTSLQDYNKMLFYNYLFSKKLFSICEKHNKKVIYSSSASVTGTDGVPLNIYAWSKLMAEDYGVNKCKNIVSLRYFNVYGPGEEHKGKMSSVAFQAWEKGEFKLFPLKPKRDFVHVFDVVSANIAAMDAKPGVYEVGSGTAMPFESMLEHLGVNFHYHSEESIPEWYQFYTESNKKFWIPGWKPKFNLEMGMKNYKEYLGKKNNGNSLD
tara:strand:- start:266 stop:1075 length:810 start_codon:yes stop_codon:yes gene_type:complete